MKHPRRILITGATGAIGSALAIRYAAPGIHLLLQGRRSELLAGLQWQCLERGATVETVTLDLCDRQELAAWLDQICQAPLPELVVLNAGLNTHIGPRGEPEPWAQVEAVVEVNLRASIFIAQRLLPGMLARGYGQLALMSSLAACFGLPVTPAYCATKAGLKAYGQALRGWLSPQGIEVNVILPGYVDSPMCHDMPGPQTFSVEREQGGAVYPTRSGPQSGQYQLPLSAELGRLVVANTTDGVIAAHCGLARV